MSWTEKEKRVYYFSQLKKGRKPSEVIAEMDRIEREERIKEVKAERRSEKRTSTRTARKVLSMASKMLTGRVGGNGKKPAASRAKAKKDPPRRLHRDIQVAAMQSGSTMHGGRPDYETQPSFDLGLESGGKKRKNYGNWKL